MTDNYDQLALGWVRKEINHTLDQARQGLESFVENDQDVTQIQFCINCLHQVQGTMQMLGLDGAARLALEMETLAGKLSNDSIKLKDSAFEILMRSMLQMPGYLERVEEGQKDIPKVLLPLINELRAAASLPPAKDNEFFAAEVAHVEAPKPNETITEKEKKNSFQDNCKKLQAHFRKGLEGIKSGKNIKESLARIHKVLLKLEAFSEGSSVAKLWWIADGFIFSIAEKGLYKDKEVQELLSKTEEYLAPLVKTGKDAFANEVSEELLSKLLYFVANSTSKNKRVDQIKKEFSLEDTISQNEEIEKQQKQLTRPDSSAMASVVEAIGEEIASVKDQLDLFVRAQAKDPAQLQQLSDSLVRIADTLEILELPIPRDVIRKQTKTLQKNIDLEKLPDDSSIMDIAGALLFVDANLSNINLDVADDESEETMLELGEQQSKAAQVDDATIALVGVARKNLQLAKDGLIGYIASNYDSSELENVPSLLSEVLGAMKIVQFDEAAQILDIARQFVSDCLLATRRTPTEKQSDALADIVTSVDYYLEGTEEGNNKAIVSILNSAKPSQNVLVKMLASEPELAEVTSIEDSASDKEITSKIEDGEATASGQQQETTTRTVEQSDSEPEVEAEHTESNSANIISINQSSANKEIDESLIDDEVLEIFLEEAEEEIEVIEQTLPQWIADTKNSEALSTIRRSFHTLKGSGRLVGAVTIGELSWAVENMLNKVIEETIPAENPVLGVLNNTLTKLPFLVKEFSNKVTHEGDDVSEIIARADHLSKGLNLSDFEFQTSHGIVEDGVEETNSSESIPVLSDELESGDSEEPIDPILLEIFVNEAQVHLKSIRDFLKGTTPESSAAITDDLIRALHTLKGSAHMAKVEAIAMLSGPLEKIARLTKASNKRFEQVAINVLSNCSDFLDDTVVKLKDSMPVDKSELDALIHQIYELGHTGDKDAGATDSNLQKDQQLMSIFLTEGADVLQEINNLLAEYNESSNQSIVSEKITGEFDAFVKACEIIGLRDIQHFAAVCETVSKVKVVEQEEQSEYLRLLSSGSDALSKMLNSQVSEEDIIVPSALMEEMQSWASDISKGCAPADMDQELVELFVEEADELLETIQELMPRWQEHPNSEDITKELRRIYHTFKGSSRMAGAMNIGELGYAIEELFNSALEQGRTLSSADYHLVNTSNRKLVEMVDQLRSFIWPSSAEVEVTKLKQHLDPNFVSDVNVGTISSVSEQEETELQREDETQPLKADEEHLQVPPSEDENDSESEIDSITEVKSEIEEPQENETHVDESTPVDESKPIEESKSATVSEDRADVTESSDAVTTEDTIAPAAPVVSIGNVYQINLDEDGLEVLEIFLEEADELLISLDESLHIWSEDNSNQAAIDTMLRTLHTLKGGARLADLVVLGDLTHELETYFENINAGTAKLTPENTKHIVQGYDVIESLVSEIRDKNQMTMPNEYFDSLKKIIAGESIEPAEENVVKDSKSGKKSSGKKKASKKSSSKKKDEEEKEQSADIVSFEERKQKQEEKRQPSTAVDTVRVNSNQLEGLVNLAGETSIFRSRLEQQMSVLRYNLDEMSSTVERLKDQLRNLDIETEAQISYRREISGGTEYDDFDPLEMDRYTRQQELTRGLGESAVDLMNLKETLDSLTSDSETLLLQQGRVNTEMQESLMQTRMTPFESLVPRLRRMVRQIGTELGKTIELSISADGEMDRSVLERMIAPLEHMLRNAMDHGIESPAQRKKNKKPETGKISIALYREGSEVFIKIRDDGRGLDLDAIRTKAIERGLISKETELTPSELRQLILEAGFSTAEKVTQISGRGVGMDVVNSEIKQMGGVIEIDSQVGLGSTFTVRLPFTVSVNHALMVQIGDEIYAIPLSNIEGIVRVSPFELEEYYSNTESKFAYAGIDYSMYYLGEMLDHHSKAKLEGVSQPLPVLLLHGADHPTALQVDDLLGSREIVVKSIGSQLSSVSGLSGATIQGDGRVVLILDMPALIRRVDAQISELPILSDTVQENRIPKVMVVDDSITVRKVTTRLLERHDFEVITAKDGVDAVTVLTDTIPDVMLLDIEMPRMDGFELATIIRHDERLKEIPIIMITSRTGEKHRQRAESIGVNRYMGKPYNEVDLLDTINSLLAKDS
jgi:chemosensory pili system protein ChpA (sensor histidine kinase/response regulator)